MHLLVNPLDSFCLPSWQDGGQRHTDLGGERPTWWVSEATRPPAKLGWVWYVGAGGSQAIIHKHWFLDPHILPRSSSKLYRYIVFKLQAQASRRFYLLYFHKFKWVGTNILILQPKWPCSGSQLIGWKGKATIGWEDEGVLLNFRSLRVQRVTKLAQTSLSGFKCLWNWGWPK